MRPHVIHRLAAAIALAAAAAAAHVQAADAEPLRIEQFSADREPEQVLYLEPVIDGLPTGKVVQIRYRDGHYFGCADDLPEVLGRFDFPGEQFIALEHVGNVKVEYDCAAQQLKIDVPPDWLPPQFIGDRYQPGRAAAAVSFGMLLNYDIYTSSPASGAGVTSLWSQQRIFDRWGSISNTGIYRHRQGAQAMALPDGYLRYDTSWSLADEERLLTYTAGDLVTGALPWNSAVRFGGLAIERDFKVRPDIVTYPLPQFSGQAAAPSTVDLFINGSKLSTAQVKPGPFTFDTVPFITGAGEAQIVTMDALGRQVSTTVPFYVASSLLRKGLSTYSLAAGKMRKGYGLDSFSYGKAAASASGRYGITDGLTLEGHAEAGERFGLAGFGVAAQAGRLGVISLAAARSGMSALSGNQYAAGYSYASPDFSIALQRIQRDAAFRDLSQYDAAAGARNLLARASTQATAAIRLDRLGGTLGAGYFNVEAADGQRTRLANLSYNRSVFNAAFIHASLNKAVGQHGIAVQLQLIVPIGKGETFSASLNRAADGNLSDRVQFSRSVPSDGGLGFDLAYAGGGAHYRQASAAWRNPYLEARGGLYGEGTGKQGYTRWLDLQGSLVFMGGGVRAANRVGDAFVLIDTQGYPGIPVRYENQLIGKTDSEGRLLVPWAPSYYSARYEIDPLALPADVSAPEVERRTAVRARSGAMISFPVKRIVAATIILVDKAGKPLPLGSQVRHRENQSSALVGWNGMTYLEGLAEHNHLLVTTPDGGECAAEFVFDVKSNGGANVGPLACE